MRNNDVYSSGQFGGKTQDINQLADQTAKQGYQAPFKIFKTADVDFQEKSEETAAQKQVAGSFGIKMDTNQGGKFGAKFAPTFTQ